MKPLKDERLGMTYKNNNGEEFIIIEYNNATDVTVMFLDDNKFKVHTQYYNIKVGNVRNPYYPNIYKIGYVGSGSHIATVNRKATHKYETWRDMLKRCYSTKSQVKNPYYIGTTVCEEWHNFQNFGDWYDENYYKIDGEIMNLDKDIVIKGNKIYSPESCVFVPSSINSIFTKSDKVRGKYMIGVNFHSRDKIFEAGCCDMLLESGAKKPRKYLGRFNSEQEAFVAYKNYKENYIKNVADYYKESIPEKLYLAMYRWIVEPTD